MLHDWCPKSPIWEKETVDLFPKSIPSPRPDISLKTLLEKSESFRRQFPIDTNRCKHLRNMISESTLERNINSAYPVIHENVLYLYAKFILFKNKYGNNIEKRLYKTMDLSEFIDRLLTKRAVSFLGKNDTCLLLDGKMEANIWNTIGTTGEKQPFILENCLSYDEIKLSAFLSVSSYTYFVNTGSRKNFGIFTEDRSLVQEEGIIVGVIGPRLVKPRVMEYEEMIISKEQHQKSNGYGRDSCPSIHHLFAEFYDENCFDYEEMLKLERATPMRFTDLKNGEMLDHFVYYKRLIFSLDTFFLEANQRAFEKGTTAYAHVVGLGLGVWRKTPIQNKIFMEACAKRIKCLGDCLHNVSDIRFAWISHNSCGGYKDGDLIPIEKHPNGGIKIYLNRQDPHEKLSKEHINKLLVVCYPWDGNALPGNEYWIEALGSSGDSAAASSTQISELHNPFINSKVSAANLRVIISGGKMMTFEEFVTSREKK